MSDPKFCTFYQNYFILSDLKRKIRFFFLFLANTCSVVFIVCINQEEDDQNLALSESTRREKYITSEYRLVNFGPDQMSELVAVAGEYWWGYPKINIKRQTKLPPWFPQAGTMRMSYSFVVDVGQYLLL